MKKQTQTSNQDIIDSYDYLGSACSSMDCTGLIPAGVTSKDQWNAYEELYPYQPPKPSRKPPEEIKLPPASNVNTTIPQELPSRSQDNLELKA